MAINDFATLSAAIANWLHRDDLTEIIPDLITLAEEKISTDLNARLMESRAIYQMAQGKQYISTPEGLLEVRRLVVLTEPVAVLQYVTPDQISEDYPLSSQGIPRVFAVIGGQIQIAPIADASYTVELSYRQKLPPVTGEPGRETNWLLKSHPSAYLYGALAMAQPYVMDDARLPMFAELYRSTIDSINNVDWYSGSTMRVRAR